MQDHAQINKYIYIYIYTLLPVSRVFGARSGSPQIILYVTSRARHRVLPLCRCSLVPSPSQLFSLAGKKRERAWDLKSRDKCWQNGVALALPQSVDFKPVWRLRSIKRSSARPLRIVLPSLTVSVVFFFTRIEPERSKIALAHAQFSRSATLPTLVYGPTLRT